MCYKQKTLPPKQLDLHLTSNPPPVVTLPDVLQGKLSKKRDPSDVANRAQSHQRTSDEGIDSLNFHSTANNAGDAQANSGLWSQFIGIVISCFGKLSGVLARPPPSSGNGNNDGMVAQFWNLLRHLPRDVEMALKNLFFLHAGTDGLGGKFSVRLRDGHSCGSSYPRVGIPVLVWILICSIIHALCLVMLKVLLNLLGALGEGTPFGYYSYWFLGRFPFHVMNKVST